MQFFLGTKSHSRLVTYGTQKIIHNNLIYLLFLAGRNIHGLHGHIFAQICAQEKSQLQVSIEFESLRSRL